MNVGIPSGIPPPAERRRPHQVQVVAQYDDGAGRLAGHETAHGGRQHHRVGAERGRDARQERRHVHAVALVEVDPAEEGGHRHAREPPEDESSRVPGHSRRREAREDR